MSRRVVILTLTVVAAFHAALLYPLFTQQAKPVQEVNKRVIQGIVLALSPPQIKHIEVTKTTTPKPEPKKEVVQETVAHPAPTPIEKTVQEHVIEPVENIPLTQPDNDVEEIVIAPPLIDNAGHLKNPPPSYPRLSKRMREEGVVILELWVLEDGTVAEITVRTSSGYPRLDNAALIAVSKWRYTPATRNGEAMAYRYEQPIEFAMK